MIVRKDNITYKFNLKVAIDVKTIIICLISIQTKNFVWGGERTKFSFV